MILKDLYLIGLSGRRSCHSESRRAGRFGLGSRQGQETSSSPKPPRSFLGPTQPPIGWLQGGGGSYHVLKRPGQVMN